MTEYDPKTMTAVDLFAMAHRDILAAGAPRVHDDVAVAVATAMLKHGSLERSLIITILHEKDPVVRALRSASQK